MSQYSDWKYIWNCAFELKLGKMDQIKYVIIFVNLFISNEQIIRLLSYT